MASEICFSKTFEKYSINFKIQDCGTGTGDQRGMNGSLQKLSEKADSNSLPPKPSLLIAKITRVNW